MIWTKLEIFEWYVEKMIIENFCISLLFEVIQYLEKNYSLISAWYENAGVLQLLALAALFI